LSTETPRDEQQGPTVRELHTRLLYPFFYRAADPPAAANLLTTLVAGPGAATAVWQQGPPEELYRQELLKNVAAFLFAEDASGCKVLQVDDRHLNAWFRNGVQLHMDKGRRLLHAVTCPAIEIFLSPYGVAVLAITLAVAAEKQPTRRLSEDDAKDFNYYGAQLRVRTMPVLSVPVSSKRPAAASAVLPAADAPLDQRLGVAGGSFTLRELRDFLLQPLAPVGEVQDQFSVYTVLRLGEEVTFDGGETQQRLAPFLSGLAQIEERLHAGAPRGEINVPNLVMNSKHWAAVSFLAAAHLVADQGVPFDEQRLPNVLRKYFIPYLVALLQRLTTQRIIRDVQGTAASLAQTPGDGSSARGLDGRIADLRLEMMSFAVCSHFTEVSSRDQPNRFYDLARRGLRVGESLGIAKDALADFGAANEAKRGHEMNEKLGENIATVAAVQTKLEWLEVFIVSFYAAELSKLIAEVGHFDPRFMAISVPVWAVVTAAVLMRILRPWQHTKSALHPGYRPPAMIVLLLVVALCWAMCGFLWPRAPAESANSAPNERPAAAAGGHASPANPESPPPGRPPLRGRSAPARRP